VKRGFVSETDIQRAICDYLAVRHYFFWRNNNTPIYDATNKRFRAMPKHTMKGIPDIILVKNGQFIGFEVKSEQGKQSEEQKAFEMRCKLEGGLYHLVRSFQDVIELGY
jgi:hypothetical protein